MTGGDAATLSRRLQPLAREGRLWPAFEAALRSAGLPTDDLGEPGQRFFALDDGTAFGGFASGGAAVLLRSLVVPEVGRRRGRGGMLLQRLLAAARAAGAREAWLLTTTAAPFFARHGFVVADRADAPACVRESRQFTALCPSTAVLMRRALD